MARFKVGDRVRVIGTKGHLIPKGEIGVIYTIDPTSERMKYMVSWEHMKQWVYDDSIERVEPESKLNIEIPITSLFVTIGGKRFRLVEE